jgi:DNA-binding MltR family transcriptional regulator
MLWSWLDSVLGKTDTEAEQLATLKAIHEIDTSDDRAIAIAAGAFLEEHLALALKARFHQDEKILNEMFRVNGPLGSFSAKINMAYLIGLCSKETCKEMHTIKEIRNEFAHKGMTRNFDSQRVRDLANNLKFGKKIQITIEELSGPGGVVVGDPVFQSDERDMPKTPREHYVKSCQMIQALLVYHTTRNSPPPPTPPKLL